EDTIVDSSDVARVVSLLDRQDEEALRLGDLDGTGSVDSRDSSELARLVLGSTAPVTPPWIATVDAQGGTLQLGETTVIIPPGSVVGEPAIIRLQKMGLTRFGTTND